MAGYSTTPLVKKLGISEGQLLSVVNGQEGFAQGLGLGPDEVRWASAREKGPIDVIVVFLTRRADLERKIATLRPKMAQTGSLWIAWPKRASKVETDVTEDVVREVALPTGLVDNKVCAIDEVWSGLRLVIRRELRQ